MVLLIMMTEIALRVMHVLRVNILIKLVMELQDIPLIGYALIVGVGLVSTLLVLVMGKDLHLRIIALLVGNVIGNLFNFIRFYSINKKRCFCLNCIDFDDFLTIFFLFRGSYISKGCDGTGKTSIQECKRCEPCGPQQYESISCIGDSFSATDNECTDCICPGDYEVDGPCSHLEIPLSCQSSKNNTTTPPPISTTPIQTTPPISTTPKPNLGESNLSSGAIAGIAIGSAVVVLPLIGIGIYFTAYGGTISTLTSTVSSLFSSSSSVQAAEKIAEEGINIAATKVHFKTTNQNPFSFFQNDNKKVYYALDQKEISINHQLHGGSFNQLFMTPIPKSTNHHASI